MPRWLRVIRGMLGTGLTFTIGVGVAASLIGVPVWLFDQISARELMGIIARCAVVAFPVGVAFSGALALTARGRTLEKLSLARVAALGAGGGLLYFALIALNAAGRWSVADALANLLILTLLGAGSAAATLLLARRAGKALRDSSPASTLAPRSARAGDLGAGAGAASGSVEPVAGPDREALAAVPPSSSIRR